MNLLHIQSSPKGNNSFSKKLGNAIIDALQEKYPDSTVHERDLAKHPFPHVEEAQITSFYTPPESRTPAMTDAIRHSDEVVAPVMAADVIVIDAPLYNFGITSSLKAWIDQLTRVNVTFRYSAGGAEGLVKGKKVYLSIASGAIYSDGPFKSYDFTEPYLRTILGFLGMTDISTYRVEGVNMPGIKDTALEKAISAIRV